MLNCIDNSGAAIVECAKVMRMKRHAKIGGYFDPPSVCRQMLNSGIGDRIIVVVQKQRNFSESGSGGSVGTSAANKVRRGDIRHAVVVRTVKKLQRDDGSVVKFGDNACVLINKAGEPIGTRLNGELLSIT
jgi:ribosomal protein L14